MRRLPVVLGALALGASLTIGPPSVANAADGQFGNPCGANNAFPNVTFVLTGTSNPLMPAAAPFGGVITKATFNVPPAAPGPFATTLRVMRATGTPHQYLAVAESPVIQVASAFATYNVRLPVKAGDLLGLHGTTSTLVCTGASPADTLEAYSGDATVGSTQTFTTAPNLSVPLVATVEPDADGDGYGDVTQDLCPQLASVQTLACPAVKLDSLASASRGKITLIVTSSAATTVSVGGVAKVNGKTIKLKAGSKPVDAGSLTQLKVKVPKPLKAALAELPPSKKVTVTLTVSAANAAGQVFTDTTKVKLPGTHR